MYRSAWANVFVKNNCQALVWLTAHITDPLATDLVQVWDNGGGWA